MAEVKQNPSKPHKKGPRQKKRSTRIDMTAMVDVAFLLLTFFILTTSLAKPGAMSLIKPIDTDSVEVNCEKMMQIYLGADDKVHWIRHCESDALKTTDFSKDGIRKDVREMKASHQDLIITIKAGKSSKFENLVDIMDEMKITGAKKYALADITPEDEALLASQGLK